MKVLVLTIENRVPDNSAMYVALADWVSLTIQIVTREQQKKLKQIIKNLELNKYDKIILDLHAAKLFGQAKVINSIPRPIIIEEDACQNYIEQSKHYGKFSAFYTKLGPFQLLCSGWGVTQKLITEGFNVSFFPKGFDSGVLYDLKIDRDIELAFIGRTKSQTYTQRSHFLRQLEQLEGLKVLRTQPGIAYRDMLNRIKYFVSADIGLQEYMVKNFEAIACGCLVFAHRQGNGEEEKLGFKDMENIVLYDELTEFREKLNYIRQNPEIERKIKINGTQLVREQHSYKILAKQLSEILNQESNFTPRHQPWHQELWKRLVYKSVTRK
jgi:glycosyltransferase involved in cell wall biosynthesis